MDQVIIRKCTVSDIENAANIDALLASYKHECSIKGMPSPLPDFKLYKHLEGAGIFQLISATIDNLLIGLIAVVSTILPHYSAVTSVTESFFVLPEYRRTGSGLRLRKAAEDHAKGLGANGLLISAPIGGALAALLENDKDYCETNRVFFKSFA